MTSPVIHRLEVVEGAGGQIKSHSILCIPSSLPKSTPNHSQTSGYYNIAMFDVSGSMNGVWKSVMQHWNNEVAPFLTGETDIYTFGTQVCFRRKETHLTQRDFDCSSTNLAAALSTINDRVRHCIQNNVRILLITDGHHNCGGSPDHKIAQMSVPFGKTVEVYLLGEGQSFPVQYSVDIRSGLHNGSASCPIIFWDRYSSDAEVLDEMKNICEEIVTGMVRVKLSLPGKVVPLTEETKLESRGGEYVYYETDPEQLISTLKFTTEDGVHIPLQVSATFCILINALIVDHTCHLAALTYVWMKIIRDYPAINRPQLFEKRISDLEATAKIYMDRPGIVNYVSSLVKDPPQALMTESGPFNDGVLNCESIIKPAFFTHLCKHQIRQSAQLPSLLKLILAEFLGRCLSSYTSRYPLMELLMTDFNEDARKEFRATITDVSWHS
ncbi:von Willebrand factor type A [Trinorchestia longiramus]|nr:von Willebrand factor type A [Trinorchestia longiramus]